MPTQLYQPLELRSYLINHDISNFQYKTRSFDFFQDTAFALNSYAISIHNTQAVKRITSRFIFHLIIILHLFQLSVTRYRTNEKNSHKKSNWTPFPDKWVIGTKRTYLSHLRITIAFQQHSISYILIKNTIYHSLKRDHFWVLHANAQLPLLHLEGKERMTPPPEPWKI